MLRNESLNLFQDILKIETSMLDSEEKVRNPRNAIAPDTNQSIILTRISNSRDEKLNQKPSQSEEMQTYTRNIKKLLPKNSYGFSTLSETESGSQGAVDPYGNRQFKNVQLTRSHDTVKKSNQVFLTRALLVSPEQ